MFQLPPLTQDPSKSLTKEGAHSSFGTGHIGNVGGRDAPVPTGCVVNSPDAVVLAVPPIEERRKSTPKNVFDRSARSSKSPSYSSGTDLGVKYL